MRKMSYNPWFWAGFFPNNFLTISHFAHACWCRMNVFKNSSILICEVNVKIITSYSIVFEWFFLFALILTTMPIRLFVDAIIQVNEVRAMYIIPKNKVKSGKKRRQVNVDLENIGFILQRYIRLLLLFVWPCLNHQYIYVCSVYRYFSISSANRMIRTDARIYLPLLFSLLFTPNILQQMKSF